MSKEKSRKQLEEEERRRAEANERAFEAWVEKKREEQKVCCIRVVGSAPLHKLIA